MGTNDMYMLYDVMVGLCHHTFRFSRGRKRHIIEQKQMFAAVARLYGAKCTDIAGFLCLKSHATVIHAVKVANGYMDVYPEFKRQFNDIVSEFEFRKAVGLLVR